MGRMSEISIQLQELEEMLYTFGLGHEPFIQECKLLCELGFADEVQCIIYEFETKVFNGELERF
jgi:hypothetical protein